jgi:hypothetical protein
VTSPRVPEQSESHAGLLDESRIGPARARFDGGGPGHQVVDRGGLLSKGHPIGATCRSRQDKVMLEAANCASRAVNADSAKAIVCYRDELSDDRGSSATSGRDADRDRARADLDAQFLAGRARTAIKFEADLLVEPDPELLSLRDLGEGRLLWMP